MSKYTTELRWIIEQINKEHSFIPANPDPVNAIQERIEHARPYIFSFPYPINELDKERFECNFLRHFYTREIGFETYTLWRFKLMDELNMIIPKYNKLWDEAVKLGDKELWDNLDYSVIREYSGLRKETGIQQDDSTRTDNLTTTDSFSSLRTDNLVEHVDKTSERTDDLSEEINKTSERTDALSEAVNKTTERTDDLTESTTGEDTDTTNRDYVRAYSDTPQGNMQNLLDEKYLTNITHEYENGSVVERAKNTVKANEGTQTTEDASTKLNTGTQTIEDSATKENTGTQTIDDDIHKVNTGTQNNTTTGTRANTGTVKNATSSQTSDNITDTQEEITHHKGKNNFMTFAEAILKARETYLNIDLMACNEMRDMFMLIW